MSRKKFSLTTIALLSCAAAQLCGDVTHFQIGTGYRQDSITLNLKERGVVNPRTKSDRHFKDLEIVTVGVKAKNSLGGCDAYVRGAFDYGWVLDGRVREQLTITDRLSNEEFDHSGYASEGYFDRSTFHNSIKRGNSYVWDFDIAFAYPLHCLCSNDAFEIAPAIGFSMDHQQLRLKRRSINSSSSCSSSSSSSCSDVANDSSSQPTRAGKFRTNWWGPWVGFDFAYNSQDCWNLYGTFEFHFGRVRRQVRTETDSQYLNDYRRTKNFYGPLFRVGTAYMLCENWYADANISYQKYFSDNNRDHISWASGQIRLDLGYVF